MIQIKREFNNGVFDCLEIYDNDFKILETTNNQLWNTNEENPVTIKKDRYNDYIVSDVKSEEIKNEEFSENI